MNSIRIEYILAFVLAAILIASSPVTLGAQNAVKKADALYKSGKFCQAIPWYSKHLNAFVDKDALVRRGRSYYHCNQLDESIRDFKNAQLLNYNDDIIEFYLAKAFQHKHEFESAILHFKNFLSQNLKDDNVRMKINREIKNCANGIRLEYEQSGAVIQNLGPVINSKGNEINMIQSPLDPNRFYYSKSSSESPGKYDIMIYSISESEWLETKKLCDSHSEINQVIAGISSDGQQLFFSRYNENAKKNTLFTDTYVKGATPFTNIQVFQGPVSYSLGDRDFYYINDSTFLFSSNRLGGFGGYDLFVTGYTNGNWFKPVNLGSVINSPYDEITPSMDPNTNVLFFSSDNTRSVGGFDIFYSTYNFNDKSWSIPMNMGFPFNSSSNDFNYKLLKNGKQAFITSDRKTSGFGGFDIYQINWEKIDEQASGNGIRAFLDERVLEIAFHRHGVQKFDLKKSDDNGKTIPDSLLKQNASVSEFETDLIQLTDKLTGGKNPSDPALIEGQSMIKIKSLFYDASTPVLQNSIQLDYINSIIKTMHLHPDFNLGMVGHISHGKSSWMDLEKSIDILLPIVKYMADEGVAPDHIFVSGAGSNLPIAKSNNNPRLDQATDRLNNRITFNLFNTANTTIEYELPFVVQHIREDDYYLYQSVERELAYKLEFDIEGPHDYDLLLEYVPYCIVDLDIFTTEKKYYFGIYTKYEGAWEALKIIEEATGKRGTIRAFVNHVPVETSNILEFAIQYTDLINLMEAKN